MLALAYVLIHLVRRLPKSDLIRQPGMLLFVLLIGLFVPPVGPVRVRPAGRLGRTCSSPLLLGLSWGTACRRYRSCAEPGWIEGLGRAFGVGLVVSIAASYPLFLLAP